MFLFLLTFCNIFNTIKDIVLNLLLVGTQLLNKNKIMYFVGLGKKGIFSILFLSLTSKYGLSQTSTTSTTFVLLCASYKTKIKWLKT